MRMWLAVLLIGGLAAGEGESPPTVPPSDPPPPAPLPLFSFSATGGTRISLSPDRPSEASGVRLRYEAVQLACDRLSYRLAALAGAPKPVLSSAEIAGGPDGRVLFDTSASQLPQMAFRGLLRPASVTVERQPSDAARPKEVAFRAEAVDLGDVAGLVMTAAGGRPHVAWAERAVITFVAAADGAGFGLTTPRLTAIHFYGRAAAGDQPARPAVVLRLRTMPPAGEATVARQLGTANIGMRAAGTTQSLFFDEQGQLSGYQNPTGDYEVTDGEDLIPRLGGSAPVLGK